MRPSSSFSIHVRIRVGERDALPGACCTRLRQRSRAAAIQALDLQHMAGEPQQQFQHHQDLVLPIDAQLRIQHFAAEFDHICTGEGFERLFAQTRQDPGVKTISNLAQRLLGIMPLCPTVRQEERICFLYRHRREA